MKGQILVLGAAGRLGFAAAEAFRDAGWSVKGLVRPGAAWRAPQGIEVIETNDRTVAVEGSARHRHRPARAQCALHRLGAARAAARLFRDRSGRAVRRDADVPRQSLQLWRRHAAGARRDDADAADLAQGQAAGRDRAAHARSRRPRRAHDHPARRRFLRPRPRLVVRPGADQGAGQEQAHLSGPARRRARMGLSAGLCRRAGPARRDPRPARTVREPSAFPATPSPARNWSPPSPRRPAAHSRSATSTGG